ncbi:hypothetical protein VTH82DRAFT_4630 [Thermothelomyces myriococcoides]
MSAFLSRMPPQDIRGSNSILGQHFASQTAKDDPSLPAKLWDRAYDELKEKEAKLVDEHEKILTRQLKYGYGSQVPETQQNGIDQDNPDKRRRQMKRLIKAGLAKIDKEVRLKEKFGPAMNFVLSVKNAISSAIQAIPQAALAWGSISVALQMLVNPINETESNRKGIEQTL